MKALALLLLAISLIGSALGQDRKANPQVLVEAAPVSQPTPAPQAPPKITPPAATAMRAKFPGVPELNIDTLVFINWLVNSAITYTSDEQHYGTADHWVMNPADAKGDCEDYVLAKYDMLQKAGFPVLDHARIRSVMAVTTGHAILELRMPETGEIVFMDNDGTSTLWTRAELVAKGYKFYDW